MQELKRKKREQIPQFTQACTIEPRRMDTSRMVSAARIELTSKFRKVQDAAVQIVPRARTHLNMQKNALLSVISS